MSTPKELLFRLADTYGIETGYHDDRGHWHEAAADGRMRGLGWRGAPRARMEEAGDALRERSQSLWRRWIEPVVVAWDGHGAAPLVRLPARENGSLACRLEFESGETRFWSTP